MKLAPFPPSHAKQRGMTLLELTVVILVFLGLMGILYVGAKAWKRGSDRSMSILLIRSAQMGLRSHVQIEGITDSSYPDLPEALFGHGKFVSNGIDRDTGLPKPVGSLPDHPVPSLSFDFVASDSDLIPPVGELYICTGGGGSVNDFTYNPQPSVYKQW